MMIKICGLKDVESAVTAAELGADLLGFVFAASPRRVAPEQVRSIIQALPGAVGKIGVFVDENPAVINEHVSYCGLDLVQLHGRETSEDCRQVACPVIKVIRVQDAASLAGMEEYRNSVKMFLLDTYIQGQAGGTGRAFDWSLARRAAGYGKIILAGGLNPANVQAALAAAKPYGVDVSSGVETGGRKDPAKIAEFINQVRGSENACVTG